MLKISKPPVRVGQIWICTMTDNRFEVVAVNRQTVTARCLDMPSVGRYVHDDCFGFRKSAFEDGAMVFEDVKEWTREGVEMTPERHRPRVRVRYGRNCGDGFSIKASLSRRGGCGRVVWKCIGQNE